MNGPDVARALIAGVRNATIATASLEGKPEAATVFFAEQDGAFYFNTSTAYRKYTNLVANPRASLVISSESQTLQVDGEVEELAGDREQAAIRILEARRGAPSRFGADPRLRHFCLKPTWMRVMIDPGPPARHQVLLGDGP